MKREKSGAAGALLTCNPANAREARLMGNRGCGSVEEGKRPNFGILPRPLLGSALLGKHIYLK